MNEIFIYAVLFSIFAVYAVGNVSKMLRNILSMTIFFYSISFILNTGGINFEFTVIPAAVIDIGFAPNMHGLIFSFLNHTVFAIYILRSMIKEKHESESSYYMNMLFLFFSANLIFFAKNMESAVMMFEISIYFMLSIIATNINERKTMNDLVFINSILSGAAVTSLILLKSLPVVSYYVFMVSLLGRVFMIPFNARFFEALKKAGIIMLGYMMFVLFLLSLSINQTLIYSDADAVFMKHSYLVFMPFLVLSSLKALASGNLKQMLFYMFVASISYHLLLAFSHVADFSFLLNASAVSSISFAILFAVCDRIEEEYLTTEFRVLEGVHSQIAFAPYLVIFALLSLLYFPLSASSISNPFYFDYPLIIKILFLVYIFSISVVAFKCIALLFFNSASYKPLSYKNKRRSKVNAYFDSSLLFVSIVFLLFSIGFYVKPASLCIEEVIRPENLIASRGYREEGILYNLASFILIAVLTEIFFLRRRFTNNSNGSNTEIAYSIGSSDHSFERNINLNGLDFYGFSDKKLRNILSYADFDNVVRLIGKTLTDLGSFVAKLYQRSISAVFIIFILFFAVMLIFYGAVS
ncbi:MAG: hypothetical protein PHW02_00955 [bacterium]|nr:hypothetical protein [bacterium]